jgi:acetylglutamate kinase
MKDLYIIKIGGNIIDKEVALSTFIDQFAEFPKHKILVHGGGKLATDLAGRLNVPQQMVDGRRVTDAETLKITAMVYSGWINKTLVARLNAAGLDAIGLTGADARLIPAKKRPVGTVDYGFVGDIKAAKVNTDFLLQCLEDDLTPVIAPISADKTGQLLNINADTIARCLAIALARQKVRVWLIYGFDRDGVLEDVNRPETLVPVLNEQIYLDLKNRNLIHSGMIPKIDNAFAAIRKGVHRVVLGRAERLNKLISGKTGTTILLS